LNMRTLVVDDNPTMRDLVQDVLVARGHEVHTSADGDSAWAAYQQLPFNLLVVDWLLPGTDGLELCRRVRSTPAGDTTAILLITGRDNSADLAEVLAAGANDYLAKPFTLADLEVRLSIVERLAVTLTEHRRAEEERLQLVREQAAKEQLRFLADASAQLASTLEVDAILQQVVRLCVSELADWCVLDCIEQDGRVRRIAMNHRPETKEVRLSNEHIAADVPGDNGGVRVLQTGRSVLHARVSREELAAVAIDDEHFQQLKEGRARSMMIVPLNGQRRILGSLVFIAADPRRYGATELALAEDLARRAALAIDNAWLYEELQRALRTRDEFISLAAHELKTPISTIKAYAEVLREFGTARTQPEESRALEAIDRQCARLGRLVQELVEFSRLELGRLQLHRRRFELGELAAEVLEQMQTVSRRHRLLLRHEALTVVEADRYRIEQVLLNLLANAVQFSPDGGDVELRIGIRDHEAVVSVRDQGIGIPPERQARLFEQFYRAHASTAHDYGGMGLGLHLSRRFVQMHGGRMWFESEEGRGSTFSFSLPLADETEEPSHA
jgi:signal transduction histidine kinase